VENEGSEMKEFSDTRYVYAVSRIRAIERKMLSLAQLERMIEAKSPAEALKVLVEANYGYSSNDKRTVDFEQMLQEEQEKVYKLLVEMALDMGEFDWYYIKNDYHNLKVYLKAEFSQQDVNATFLAKPSLLPADALAAMLRERDFRNLPDPMQVSVEACLDAFNKTFDPQVIDIILDKGLYSHMLVLAKKLNNDFVTKLVTMMIDLANIKMVLRAQLIGKPWDFIERFLVPGGEIDFSLFAQQMQLDLNQIVKVYAATAYAQLITDSLRIFQQTQSLAGFEKLSDNYLMSWLKRSKYAIFGIEPLVTYLLAKETEIKNVRIIMVGKINNLAQDVIRERLRETYV